VFASSYDDPIAWGAALRALMPELDVREMNARCCGIAGTYGLKAEKYDIAMAVGALRLTIIDLESPKGEGNA